MTAIERVDKKLDGILEALAETLEVLAKIVAEQSKPEVHNHYHHYHYPQRTYYPNWPWGYGTWSSSSGNTTSGGGINWNTGGGSLGSGPTAT